MLRKTLISIILTGTVLIAPQTTISSATNYSDFIESTSSNKPITSTANSAIFLEKAGLEVYGENPQALGTTFLEFYRLVYSSVNDVRNPLGLNDFGKKTNQELQKGLELKNSLEIKYDLLFTEYAKYNNLNTFNINWDKLFIKNKIIPKNTYCSPGHEALDIFASEGVEVFAPFNGVIVAYGDYWDGTFIDGKISTWNNKGLTPRAGNSIIIYNPKDNGYLLLSHLKEGICVNAGDVVSKGQLLGYVGNSGSASIKGHGGHVHAAYKLRDNKGYLKGINFSHLLDN